MRDDLVILRPEGLYCPAGDFHIDPWRPVPRAVITHGHADHARSGMGEYHAVAEGLPILRHRLGEAAVLRGYGYGEAFAFGPVRVSLHPAGHILGSAQVRIELDGRVWVVTGDYKRDPDPSCTAFEPVACETLITEATFGFPCYRWPDTAAVVREILRWWDGRAAAGETALLGCYALGKAQRLLAELARVCDRPVHLHGAMVGLVDLYRAAGVAMAPTIAVADEPRGRDLAGALVLAPPSAFGSPWIRRFGKAQVAFASGWMQVRGHRRRRGVDRGFVVSDHADWPGLVRTVRESGARRVLATHGQCEPLVRWLGEQGIAAEVLRTELGGEE
jgi:putative mRNA 3-end processing factor